LNDNPVNLSDYPLDEPEGPVYSTLVEASSQALRQDGFLNLDGFLTSRGVERLMADVECLLPSAHRSCRHDNAYGATPSDDLPADHPDRILRPTDRYGLAYHQMRGTALDTLYVWPPLRQFVADITRHQALYLHDDPSNALVLQVYKTGGGLAWHFDQAQFSTILNLSESEAGGVFEYAANIRSADDPRYDDVRDVLLERSDKVRRVHARRGSLSIIYGRHTLHRVTAIEGPSSRSSVVLSYEDRPGVRMDVETRRKLFGPTAPMD